VPGLTLLAVGRSPDAERLKAILLGRALCVAEVPADLKRVLLANHCCNAEVIPRFVRGLLREAAQGPRDGRWPTDPQDAQFLLLYCASDISGDFAQLDGLPLVPLADGSLGNFAVVPREGGARPGAL
jgi:hypothetical protein